MRCCNESLTMRAQSKIAEIAIVNVDMQALYVFLFTGFVAMSAALSAGAINKLPEESKPDFVKKSNGQVTVIMMGNFAALVLIAAMAYGVLNLEWYIPLTCMIITFPVIHVMLVQRLLGDLKALFVMTPLVAFSAAALYYYW